MDMLMTAETERKTKKAGHLNILFSEKLHQVVPVYFQESIWHILQSIRDLAPYSCEEHSQFNYGFFVRQTMESEEGIFISEEKCIGEILDIYSETPPVVEYMLKRRNNKDQLDIRQVNKMNNKVNQKKCFELVTSGQTGKLEALLATGVDPNFLSDESGESPLTYSTSAKSTSNFIEMIMTLFNGGAILHYRNREGLTPMHRAVLDGKLDSVKKLLILGASPCSLDAKNLTPLFRACQMQNSREICEILLRDRSVIGCTDINGWSELHHAAKWGMVDIMELLIWYGANINAQNSGGNTPLHICGVHEQEAAGIVLLRRGADRNLANNSHRTPCQVAIISGNKNVANRIESHVDQEVVKFSDRPSYNPRARPVSHLYQLCVIKKSSGNPSVSKSKTVELAQSSEGAVNSKFGSLKRSMFRSANKKSSSDMRTRIRPVPNKNTNVVTKKFTPQHIDDLSLTVGDNVTVLFIGREGYIEGTCNGKQGWFPSSCVEQINESEIAKKVDKQKINQDVKPKKIKIKKTSKGFGFSIRGATNDNKNFHPTPLLPSLHLVAQVDAGGAAEKAALEVGHFILIINSQNVITASHNEVVGLVRNTKKVLEMTVTRSLRSRASEISVKTIPPPFTNEKPVVPPRTRQIPKIEADNVPEVADAKLRNSASPPIRDERRLGHVNPLFFVQEEPQGNVTPPIIKSRSEYATVRKEIKNDNIQSKISSNEDVYMYGQRHDDLQSKSDTLLTTRHSEEACLPNRNLVSGSVEISYNESTQSSSSNADMRTDSKVSDFTIESGYFYNSQGELVADARLGPETAITKTNSVYVDDELGAQAEGTYAYEFSGKELENTDHHPQDYFSTFSNASLENNKADSTFDDEADFTPFDRLPPNEDPPYDTLDRKDLFYSGFEGDETYDHLNFGTNYYSNTPSDGDTLEGELADSYDCDQYEHLQTEEDFYQIIAKTDSNEELPGGNYEIEEGQLDNYDDGDDDVPVDEYADKENENVGKKLVEDENRDNLSQFAKAVLEKSLTLKRRRSGQTESNSASETGSNLSLKNSESDKKPESLTSDLGTDISSTFDTDNTIQQALLNNFASPAREPQNKTDPILPQDKQDEEDEFLITDPAEQDYDGLPSPPVIQPTTEHEPRDFSANEVKLRSTSGNVHDPVIRRSDSPQFGAPLDERNPRHWKHLLKKVPREAPSKPDEGYAFVSRQLAAPGSKSCDNLYSSAMTSSPVAVARTTFMLEEEQRIASRIPSIYTQEHLTDLDQYSYWKDHLNTPQATKKKSNSDSELSKLASEVSSIDNPPPLPNYSTFPGELPQYGFKEETQPPYDEPYTDFTPSPIDIIDELDVPSQLYTPPFDYLQGIPSPPSSRPILETRSLFMSPPEGFDSTDQIDLLVPPPPIIEGSFAESELFPPPPSSLELKRMREQENAAPPEEILYRMDLKHSRRFKKPGEWSTDEVGDWLESFAMEIYRNNFIENDIQGSHLQLLTKEDLTALEITKLGHKMTILKEISKLHF